MESSDDAVELDDEPLSTGRLAESGTDDDFGDGNTNVGATEEDPIRLFDVEASEKKENKSFCFQNVWKPVL